MPPDASPHPPSHVVIAPARRGLIALGLVYTALALGCPPDTGSPGDGDGPPLDGGAEARDAGGRDGGATRDGGGPPSPVCGLGVTTAPNLSAAAANTIRVRIDGATPVTLASGSATTTTDAPWAAAAGYAAEIEDVAVAVYFDRLTPAQCDADPGRATPEEAGMTFTLTAAGVTSVVQDGACRIVSRPTDEAGAPSPVLRGYSNVCTLADPNGDSRQVEFTFDFPVDDATCRPLNDAPPSALPDVALDELILARPGEDDVILPRTAFDVVASPDDPHPLYAFFDNGTQQVQLDLKDLAAGTCDWSVVSGIVPYGHQNTVRFLNDSAPYSGTADADCEIVITEGYDESTGLAGYAPTCALRNDAFPGMTQDVSFRFRLGPL